MTIATMPEQVTRGEFDIKLKNLEDRGEMRQALTDEKISSMERMIDVKLSRMEALIDRSISENRAMISEIRTEMSDVRGDIKALKARQSTFETKFGWYLTIFGVGITIAIGVMQLLIKP